MKKFFILAAVLFPAFCGAEEYCLQREQAALSPDGDCEIFDSPCDIPSDWKRVPRCDLIRDKDFGSRPEDVAARRAVGFYQTLEQIQRANELDEKFDDRTKVGGRTLRVGRAQDTRPSVDDRTADRKNTASSAFSVRGRTMPKYGDSEAYERFKELNPWYGGYQHKGDTTQEERMARYQAKPAQMSRTDADREGYLSNEPKWSEASKTHFKREMGSQRYWRGGYYRDTDTSDDDDTSSPSTLQLRRVYRESQVGDLDGSIDLDLHRERVERAREMAQ